GKAIKGRTVVNPFRERVQDFYRMQGGGLQQIQPQAITAESPMDLGAGSLYTSNVIVPGETAPRTIMPASVMVGATPFSPGEAISYQHSRFGKGISAAGFQKPIHKSLELDREGGYMDLYNMRFEMEKGFIGSVIPAGQRAKVGTMYRGEEETPLYLDAAKSPLVVKSAQINLAAAMSQDMQPLGRTNIRGAQSIDPLAEMLREQVGGTGWTVGTGSRASDPLSMMIQTTQVTELAAKGSGLKAGIGYHGGEAQSHIRTQGGGFLPVDMFTGELKAVEPFMRDVFGTFSNPMQQEMLAQMDPTLARTFGETYNVPGSPTDQPVDWAGLASTAGMTPGELGAGLGRAFYNAPEEQQAINAARFGIARTAEDQMVDVSV
ncbi:hypothetical protein LCGC14_2942740, partial [marine sediment metagenome]